MAEKPRRNWLVPAAFGGLAFMAGAALTRVGPVYRAIQRLDWTTVFESVAGAGIPLAFTGTVGVLIGRRLSKNAALDLQESLEDLNERRERSRADLRAADRHARRDAWENLHTACQLMLKPGLWDRGSYAHEVGQAAIRQFVAESAAGVPKRAPEHQVDARAATICAWYDCEWGERLKAHLPSLKQRLLALRDEHQVEDLHVVIATLEVVGDFVTSTSWSGRDTEKFVDETRGGREGLSWSRAMLQLTGDCIDVLTKIADRQRRAPHEADDFDVELQRQSGDRTYTSNLLSMFTALGDKLAAGSPD